jgi:hypothetical protein
MPSPAINSPGDATRSKASPELREFARQFIACANAHDADAFDVGTAFAIACELEGVSLFKLIAEEQGAKGGN